jgi:hypothetical protein
MLIYLALLLQNVNIFGFPIFDFEFIWLKSFQKHVVIIKFDTSVGGLLVPEGIIIKFSAHGVFLE